MLGTVKQWARTKEACEIFAIGRDELLDAYEKGFIRVKGGSVKGSDRKFCCEDIHNYNLKMAAGRKPTVMRGRVK